MSYCHGHSISINSSKYSLHLPQIVFFLINGMLQQLLGAYCHLTVHECVHSKKMLGCFNPSLGQIWTNSAIGLKLNKLIHSVLNN